MSDMRMTVMTGLSSRTVKSAVRRDSAVHLEHASALDILRLVLAEAQKVGCQKRIKRASRASTGRPAVVEIAPSAPGRRALAESLLAFALGVGSRLVGAWRTAGEFRLQLCQPPCQVFLLGSGVGRHRLDRFELVAADQVEIGNQAFDALADHSLDFLPDPDDGGSRAAGYLCQVVEEAIAGLHASLPRARIVQL